MTSEPEMSRIERQKAKNREVEEEFAKKFEWGKSMVVVDPKTGDLDDERTKDEIKHHDITVAQVIRKRHGDGYFVVPDAAQTSVFRRWDGQIWRIDLGEGNAHALIQDYWEQMRYALDQIKDKIVLLAEKKVHEEGLSGD